MTPIRANQIFLRCKVLKGLLLPPAAPGAGQLSALHSTRCQTARTSGSCGSNFPCTRLRCVHAAQQMPPSTMQSARLLERHFPISPPLLPRRVIIHGHMHPGNQKAAARRILSKQIGCPLTYRLSPGMTRATGRLIQLSAGWKMSVWSSTGPGYRAQLKQAAKVGNKMTLTMGID